MAAVAREALEGIDIGDIIQELTAGIATDTMEAVRVQAMNADDLLARIVDRLLGRRRPARSVPRPPAGAVTLARSTAAVRARQGQRAGLASRLLAAAIDLVVVVFILIGVLIVGTGIRALFTGTFEVEVRSGDSGGRSPRWCCSPTSPTAGASTGGPSAWS